MRNEMTTPKRDAAYEADRAGLLAMDGVPWPKCQDAYVKAFDAVMRSHGYVDAAAPCDCADEGEEGHAPQCGYALAKAEGVEEPEEVSV